MKFFFTLTVLLVLSLPAWAVPCVSEKEARADALIGFFTVRHLSADLCQDRLGIMGMVALRKQVKAKFKGRIEAAGKIRERYFQRIYGQKVEGIPIPGQPKIRPFNTSHRPPKPEAMFRVEGRSPPTTCRGVGLRRAEGGTGFFENSQRSASADLQRGVRVKIGGGL